MFVTYLFMEVVQPYLDLLVSVFVLMCCFKYLASKSLRDKELGDGDENDRNKRRAKDDGDNRH